MSRPHMDFTWRDLGGKIENEGFDYFFRHWVSVEGFTDPVLRGLVNAYNESARALEGYLKKRGVEL